MPNASDNQPRGMTYGKLSKKHPEYNAKRFETIEDLYEGGWCMVDKASKYVPQLVGEHAERYETRCRMTSYQPYFGQIVDSFVSDLFNQPLSLKPAPKKTADGKTEPQDAPPYYADLETNADGNGTPFVDVLGDAMSAALRKRRGIIAIDTMAPDPFAPEPKTRAEEEAAGLDRIYCYELPAEQIIDWRMDRRNKTCFEWVIRWECEKERESPYGDREAITETFTVWTMGPTGKAHWDRYVCTYKPSEKPAEDDIVNLVASGDTSFDRIPIIPRVLPKGLDVGNKIGPQALEHFQRRSALLGAENSSMVAIPYVARGSEIGSMGGAMPGETQQDPSRGSDPVGKFNKRGWVTIGAGDRLDFAEPEGKAYDLIDKQLDDLRKDMFAVNFQMAASVRPTPGAMARSGKSKEKDGEATAKVLRKLGSEARHWAKQVFDCISVARGETIEWVAHGLDQFESDSREEVLEEAIIIPQIAIRSETFRAAHQKKVARQVLENADPDTFARIDAEIDSSVSEDMKHEALEREVDQAQQEAKRDVAQDPMSHQARPPMAMGPKGPQVKQPNVKPKDGDK